jgi:DNA-binding HxlR family transcriptional regulator
MLDEPEPNAPLDDEIPIEASLQPASDTKKRTGKTRDHYNKQKSQAFSYFRIDNSDLDKMQNKEFTIYNFITNSFAFSQTKKELTIKVLEELKKGDMTFISLQRKLDAKKSTLYMLIIALQKSGLITEAQKNGPLKLSDSFSQTIRLYSDWWDRWLKE